MLNTSELSAFYLKKINRFTKSLVSNVQKRQPHTLNSILEAYLTHKNTIKNGYLFLILFFFTKQAIKALKPSFASNTDTIQSNTVTNHPSATTSHFSTKAKLDQKFFTSLKNIIKIIVPGFKSFEFRILALQSVLLIARTALSVFIASLDGEIVSNIVHLRLKKFIKGISTWLLISIPAALVNSSLEYLQQLLALRFRKRLTARIHDFYFRNRSFYAIPNLDSRLQNVDQVIVVDVQKFCHLLSLLYSNITKPILDCVVYNVILAKNVGLNSLLALGAVVQISTGVLRALTPPFGSLGDLHYAHSRVINNAEEIALWKGHDFEKQVIQNKYSRLAKHVNRVFRLNIFYQMMEDFVIKYFWGAAGLLVCAAPVFAERILTIEELEQNKAKNIFFLQSNKHDDIAFASRVKEFVSNRRLLLSSSDAVGRIIYTYKELVQLSGYTKRVSELLEVLDDVSKGKFIKNKISLLGQDSQNSLNFIQVDTQNMDRKFGLVVESDYIFFDKVPVVSPTGDVLIEKLSYVVQPGMNLLVLGPNGCGKSSMFRILGGLWPIYGGTLYCPSPQKIFYLPQKPYMCIGTLRDQIIYPHSILDMIESGITDNDVLEILRILQLDNIVTREGGFDIVKEWRDCLSAGDKQKFL
ncbi:hypothetical protein BB561_005622 [Smittium simulii]|uniref:Uncharacterized protein n=1 Tax=Smittium simulii TaxID=133385 RepID=A0A2T9Y9H8_9FUNG|nr:hypothetical protein BB561_005622 [Smittium simulii]